MSYASIVSLAPAAGTVSINSYRGNGVYDPDFTGVGTTAYTYSQLSALYNRYRVIGSRIFVNFTNTGTGVQTHLLQASIANSPPTTVQWFGGRHMARGTTSPGKPAFTHIASARTAKIFGVPESQVMSEDDFAGLVGGNPNNVWYWHIGSYNPTAAATTGTVDVRIEYDVIWSMPLNIAP